MSKELISTLHSQHEALMALFQKASLLSDAPEPPYQEIAETLKAIGEMFVGHIYMENNELYPGIFKHPGMEKTSTECAKNLMEDMKSIQDDVIHFLNKYHTDEKLREEYAVFKVELKDAEKRLRSRILLEENTLFVLDRE